MTLDWKCDTWWSNRTVLPEFLSCGDLNTVPVPHQCRVLAGHHQFEDYRYWRPIWKESIIGCLAVVRSFGSDNEDLHLSYIYSRLYMHLPSNPAKQKVHASLDSKAPEHDAVHATRCSKKHAREAS